jgi:hypothetical protein
MPLHHPGHLGFSGAAAQKAPKELDAGRAGGFCLVFRFPRLVRVGQRGPRWSPACGAVALSGGNCWAGHGTGIDVRAAQRYSERINPHRIDGEAFVPRTGVCCACHPGDAAGPSHNSSFCRIPPPWEAAAKSARLSLSPGRPTRSWWRPQRNQRNQQPVLPALIGLGGADGGLYPA